MICGGGVGNEDGSDEASYNCKVVGTPTSYFRSPQHNFNHEIKSTA